MQKKEDVAAKTHEELVTLVLDLQSKVSDLSALIERERNGAPERITYSHDPIRRPDGRGGHRPGWWTRTFSRVPVLDTNGIPTGKYRTTAGWLSLKPKGKEPPEDRKEADRLLTKLAKAPTATPKGGPKVVFLRTLVEGYIAAKKAADKVTPAREQQIRWIAASLAPGDVLIEKITEDDIKRAVASSPRGAALTAAGRMFRFQILRALFNFAVKKKSGVQLLKVSPCAALEADDVGAAVTKKTPIKVKAEDRARIVKGAYDMSEELGAVMEFLYRTGWRPVMATRLKFADVDLATGEITVTRTITRKGKGERVTKVSAAALAILQKRAALARLDGCGDEDAFRRHLVFWRNGKAASVRWLAERFGRIVKTLKVRGQFGKVPTLYALRKGFAADLQAAGATAYAKQAALCDVSGESMIDQSMRDTMADMGHSDPNMVTRHYADGTEALEVVLKKLPGGSA